MSEMILRLPSSYVDVESNEMEYIDGGMSATDIVLSALIGMVTGVASSKIAPYCTLANFKAALSYAGAGAGVVWAAVGNAVAWVWNTPVVLACVGVAVGASLGIMGSYVWYKYHVQ